MLGQERNMMQRGGGYGRQLGGRVGQVERFSVKPETSTPVEEEPATSDEETGTDEETEEESDKAA